MEKVKITVEINVSDKSKKLLQKMAMYMSLEYLDGIAIWDWKEILIHALEVGDYLDSLILEHTREWYKEGYGYLQRGLEDRYKWYLSMNPWLIEESNKPLTTRQVKTLFELSDVLKELDRDIQTEVNGFVCVYDKNTYENMRFYKSHSEALKKEREPMPVLQSGLGSESEEQ